MLASWLALARFTDISQIDHTLHAVKSKPWRLDAEIEATNFGGSLQYRGVAVKRNLT
jgi:hypothetical protein